MRNRRARVQTRATTHKSTRGVRSRSEVSHDRSGANSDRLTTRVFGLEVTRRDTCARATARETSWARRVECACRVGASRWTKLSEFSRENFSLNSRDPLPSQLYKSFASTHDRRIAVVRARGLADENEKVESSRDDSSYRKYS